jgi:hypothetical protein
MASATYNLFAAAMAARKPIVCIYEGHPRAICPIILGHSGTEEMALAFQYDGSGSKGPVHGEWRCFEIAKVSRAELIDGQWRSGRGHNQPQECVKNVDLDVNAESPYSPKRRLQPN